MKNFMTAAFAGMLLLSAAGCSRAHYVSAQPGTVVVTRPVAPGPNYVWVDGDYMWSGDRYVYRPGHWIVPGAGYTYCAGSWQNSPRGYYWCRSAWVR